MNSHLGRFLVQADELIQECRTFGESLRTSLEAELEKLNDTVAHTLDSTAKRTAEHAAARFGTQLETALGARLAELRQKLDDMGRLADRAATARADAGAALPAGLPVTGTAVGAPASRVAARQPGSRALIALVASAYLMLAALLVLIVLDRGGGDRSADAPATTSADAGIATAGAAIEGANGAAVGAASPNASPAPGAAWVELCEPLAASPDPARAHALVAAAAAAACGDRAGAVTANALAGVRALPAEPKPGTAPAEKPSRGTKTRSREKKP
jgi:hypothetical protein